MKTYCLGMGLTLMLGLPASLSTVARADSFFISTGNPDGKIATRSRPSSAGKLEIETGDDFLLSSPTRLTSGPSRDYCPAGRRCRRLPKPALRFIGAF
jgi:hypothetical protein